MDILNIRSVIFDWKGTLYDSTKWELFDGALPLLDFFHERGIPLVLIGKGGDDMHREVDRLGVKKYFSTVLFREGEKDVEQFSSFIDSESPAATLCVGDRVQSEIRVGNQLGATTLWVRQGKFVDQEPSLPEEKPNFTVSSLRECLDTCKRLANATELR